MARYCGLISLRYYLIGIDNAAVKSFCRRVITTENGTSGRRCGLSVSGTTCDDIVQTYGECCARDFSLGSWQIRRAVDGDAIF